eukprot:1157737-Pelagomonas_calceolata.AAC.5
MGERMCCQQSCSPSYIQVKRTHVLAGTTQSNPTSPAAQKTPASGWALRLLLSKAKSPRLSKLHLQHIWVHQVAVLSSNAAQSPFEIALELNACELTCKEARLAGFLSKSLLSRSSRAGEMAISEGKNTYTTRRHKWNSNICVYARVCVCA